MSAIEVYQAAGLAPTNVYIRNNLAVCLHSLGYAEKALEHFEAVLEVLPEFVPARNVAAAILADFGKLDAAAAHLEVALAHCTTGCG